MAIKIKRPRPKRPEPTVLVHLRKVITAEGAKCRCGAFVPIRRLNIESSAWEKSDVTCPLCLTKQLRLP